MPLHVSAGKIKKLWRTDDDAVLHEIKNLWTDQGQIFSSGPTIEIHDVAVSAIRGVNTFHPLISLTPPPGETWEITVEGEVTAAGNMPYMHPLFRIGNSESDAFGVGLVRFSGEITSTASQVGVVTQDNSRSNSVDFEGTVTVAIP